MALVQTTPAQVLKRIRTDAVRGEMQLIFEIADDKHWYYEDSWDLKSFGHVRGKRQIVFKTSYSGVEKIINAHATTEWVKSSVKRIASGASKGEAKIARATSGGKPHIFLMIGEQAVKFQGTKATGSTKGSKVNAATKTKMQEIGSAYVFYLALCKGKKWKNWMELYKDPHAEPCLKKIWEGHGGDWEEDGGEWAINFFIQQKALLAKLACGGDCCLFSDFVHSDEAMKYLPGTMIGGKSFMKYITEIVGKLGISQKDNWNPADIWLIRSKAYEEAKKTIDAIMEAALDDEGKLQQLNHYTREMFGSKKIFGISLKKVTKYPASVKYFNHTTEFFTESWAKGGKGTDTHEMKYDGAICKLGLDDNDVIETQDAWYFVDDPDGGYYKFQIKGNSTTSMSTLKYEAQAEGAGEARLGKATVALVEENLKTFNVGDKFVKDKESYAMNADQFDKNKGAIQGQTWQDMLKCLQTNKVNLGDAKDADDAYSNLMIGFTTAPHVCNMKLQEIRWLCAFFAIRDEKKRDQFATNMVWLSMKAGRRYGPFAKVY